MSIPNENILHTIRKHAVRHPEKIMLVVDHAGISYGRFIEEVDAMCGVLMKYGCLSGDNVAIALPNSIDWYIIFWAAVACGARPLPVDPQMGEWELRMLFEVMDFRVCFIVNLYRANPLKDNFAAILKDRPDKTCVVCMNPQADPVPFISVTTFKENFPPVDRDTAQSAELSHILMYACTSGTTGNPKILSVEHTGFFQSQLDMANYLQLGTTDTMLLGMPLYHQGGFGMGVQALLSGGTVIYQPRFNPDQFLQTIIKYSVTAIQLTPTLAKILLTVPGFGHPALNSLRLCYFAGEVLPDDVAERFYRDLDIRVVNIIGSSETGTMVVWDSKFDQECGVNDFRPMPFTEVMLHDGQGNEVVPGETGELLVRTDAVLLEYFKNPVLSKEKIILRYGKRWFATGDCGRQLPNGRIRLMGRKKRIIKRGGNLVYPEEVEAFLLTHPLVQAVAVTCEPHEIFGEMIVARLQLVHGATLNRGELLQFCKGKISSFKIPDRLIIQDELPKDIGKIQFKYLNKQLQGNCHSGENRDPARQRCTRSGFRPSPE